MVARALADTSLAEHLAGDPAFRRWLQDDPDTALRLFHLARASEGASAEAVAVRRDVLERLVLAPER